MINLPRIGALFIGSFPQPPGLVWRVRQVRSVIS